MTDSTRTESGMKQFTESWHRHGAVICNDCDAVVELSHADDWGEAMELWNDHVEDVHAE